MKTDLSVYIADILFQNPVMNASGTFDLECYQELIDISRLGAFVSKSTTRNSRDGNSQPRTYEVRRGMINRIGLENKGVDNFVEEKLPSIHHLIKETKVVLIASAAGESIENYLGTAAILQRFSRGRIVALEINVSCPNVANGMVFGSNPDLLFDLINILRQVIDLPLIVKLTPNIKDISLAAKAAVSAGADALSLINTVKARALIKRSLHAGQWIEGGLSGPAIKKIALKKVKEVSESVDVPLIAMGGISNTEDALEFLRIKNVWAVAVGTANFRNPTIMTDIIDGLEDYLEKNKYSCIAEFKAKELVKCAS